MTSLSLRSRAGWKRPSVIWKTGSGPAPRTSANSMSRRGNCHDNAVAESFFQLLKRERIKRRIYPNREAARRDVFDYIEMFYNPTRRHGTSGRLSPVEYERHYIQSLTGV